MKIDTHVHLAGVGTGDSGCWMSESFRRRLTFRLLRIMQGISADQLRDSIDRDWAARVARLVASSELDRAVALGFDGVYDRDGRLDTACTQMLVPPDWVFRVCERHPELLPGPSLNPYRADAAERLDECMERGAVLIKWLPSTQSINPANPALESFYERLAAAGLPLLVHSGGGERTFAELRPELADLRRLRLPLERGVTVICAHAATRVLLSGDEDQQSLLLEMLEEFPNLWVDNSGIANPSRFPHLPRIAREPRIANRALHGSDFPVPVGAFYYPRELGLRRVWELQRVSNPLDRCVRLHRELGFPEESFTRAAGILRLRG